MRGKKSFYKFIKRHLSQVKSIFFELDRTPHRGHIPSRQEIIIAAPRPRPSGDLMADPASSGNGDDQVPFCLYTEYPRKCLSQMPCSPASVLVLRKLPGSVLRFQNRSIEPLYFFVCFSVFNLPSQRSKASAFVFCKKV